MPPGAFLLDDHEVVRTGPCALLEAGEDTVDVGEAGTVADAPARIPAAKPDVAILNVRLPDGSGIDIDIGGSNDPRRCCWDGVLSSHAARVATRDQLLAVPHRSPPGRPCELSIKLEPPG
jgi:two-component system, NarL family, response regulator DevR